MSSSNFALVQANMGLMGPSGAVAAAETAAYRRTAALGAQSLSSREILASTAPGSAPVGNLGQPGRASDPFISQMYAEANQACFVERNPTKCSVINQQIASAQAAATCPGGPEVIADNTRKEQGSLWRWLYQPTYVSSIKPVGQDTAAVSISLGAIQRST